MSRTQQRVLASVLAGMLAVPAGPQEYCPLPQQGQGRNPQRAAQRIVDLRRLPPTERLSVLGRLSAGELPLVNEKLLQDATFVRHLRNAKPPFVLRDGKGSLQAQRGLQRPVTGLRIVSGLPLTDAEIRHVYGPNIRINEAARRQMRQAKAEIAMLPLIAASGTIATTVIAEARRQGASTALVVLAHNDGSTLRFPDGSSVKLATLAETLATSERPMLVVSCDTATGAGFSGIATAKRIDFRAAAQALRSAQGATVHGDLVRTFASSYRSPESRTQERLVTVGVSFGTLVVILIVLGALDDDD